MNYLIDTHIFLWYINGEKFLSKKIKSKIEDTRNNIYLSTISIWECIIKAKLGKLQLPEPIYDYLNSKRIEHDIDILDLTSTSLSFLESLPDIHRDPFDRLLICQTLNSNIVLITNDKYILKYPVQTFK